MRTYWIRWANYEEPKGEHAYKNFNGVAWDVITRAHDSCAVTAILTHLNAHKNAVFLRVLPVDEFPTVEAVLSAPEKGDVGW